MEYVSRGVGGVGGVGGPAEVPLLGTPVPGTVVPGTVVSGIVDQALHKRTTYRKDLRNSKSIRCTGSRA